MTDTTAIRSGLRPTGNLTVHFPEGPPILNQRASASLLKLVLAAKSRIDAREATAE